MKKGSAVVWIVTMMLIATGVALSASSAQANDLNSDQKNIFFCGQFKQPSDEVHKVVFRSIEGDVMKFSVDLSVDPAHLAGTDGVKRLKTMKTRDGNVYWEEVGLQEVRVAVLPYDRDGKRLWRGYGLGTGPKKGRDQDVPANATLKAGVHISQVAYLLVAVGETGITAFNTGIERSNGFHLCRVVKYPPLPAQQPGGSPQRPSSTDTDLNKRKASYGLNRWPNDKVIGVRFTRVKGNVMSFEVDVSVDSAHIFNSNKDGVYRTSPLTGVYVTVLPYDRKGKRLWSTFASGYLKYPKPSGSKKVSTNTTLAAGAHFTQVADLLVAVCESAKGPNKGTRVSFCDVVKWTNVQQPKLSTVDMVYPYPKNVKTEEIILSQVETKMGVAYWMGLRQKEYNKNEVNGLVVDVENKNGPLQLFHLNDIAFYKAFGNKGIELKPGVNKINCKLINLLNYWQANVVKGGPNSVTLVIHYVED